jgi:trimethylamine--corrinoid protein Co-methyltransferase
VIDKVGPGGDFLTTPHTTEHFRSVWYPRVFDRRPYESWANTGKKLAPERAREIARQAITTHKPAPLPDETLETLTAIIAEAEARAGVRP